MAKARIVWDVDSELKTQIEQKAKANGQKISSYLKSLVTYDLSAETDLYAETHQKELISQAVCHLDTCMNHPLFQEDGDDTLQAAFHNAREVLKQLC